MKDIVRSQEKVAGKAASAEKKGHILFAHSAIEQYRVSCANPGVVVMTHPIMGRFLFVVNTHGSIIKLTHLIVAKVRMARAAAMAEKAIKSHPQ